MGYTYDDFYKEAKSAGMLEQFSEYDLDTAKKNPEFGRAMLGFKMDYNNAQTDEQRLIINEGANALRTKYGSYTGGGDGMEYNYHGSFSDKVTDTLGQAESYGSFDYSRKDEEQKLIDAILNPSYNPETDPVFGAYKKSYLREGERATANALTQAAAATGGVPSSYAVTAAQQAGNYYAGKLNDMIPTLEQNAHNRNISALGALQADRQMEHGEWQGGVNNLMTLLGGYQTQDQTEYARQQDERNWAFTEQQYADQQAMQEWEKWFSQQQFSEQQKQNLWDNAFALHQLGYTTPEIATILGIPQSSGGEEANGGTWWDPSKPWEALGMTEEEYRALYGNGGGEPPEGDATDAEKDAVDNLITSLLDTSGNSTYRVEAIAKNNPNWSPEQQAYALDVLNQYRQAGII